jgi:hypothetical protein
MAPFPSACLGLVGIQTGPVQSPIPFSSRQLVFPPLSQPSQCQHRLGETEKDLSTADARDRDGAPLKKLWLAAAAAARCRFNSADGITYCARYNHLMDRVANGEFSLPCQQGKAMGGGIVD